MNWLCYRLVFRLESPLRVGQRQVGNLQETRGYVPARALWAALTARMTRDLGQGRDEQDYRTVGSLLQANMRFGYLWPSLDGQNPCYFWDEPSEFDYNFLGSSMSTALDYKLQSTEAGSLHEAEFIAPQTRQGLPVYLVGLVWARNDIPQIGWQTAMRKVTLGGERHYGWGRLAMINEWIPLDASPIDNPDDFRWSERVLAHALPAVESPAGWQGVVEPLIGWEAHQNGRKTLTAKVQAAYAPGTLPPKDTRFRVLAIDGLWEELV